MAKKKDEKEQNSDGQLEAIQAKLAEIDKTLENFRTSFQNLETTIRNLKERNRLR